MKVIISAKVLGVLEAYKILVDNEEVAKVRGNKEAILELSDAEHIIQLKSINGKSRVINIKPDTSNEVIRLRFVAHFTKELSDNYFELVGEE